MVISATNGKTTTAAMVAGILERRGTRLVHNRAGANMAGGVATALVDAARRRARSTATSGSSRSTSSGSTAVVDELEPRALLLANLFRDQLDRYGELETIADRWAAVVAGRAEPLAARPQRRRPARRRPRPRPVTYFGVDDDCLALPELQHAADSKHCRRCGAPYVYDAIYLGHLGHYHCPNCDARRPEPRRRARDVELPGRARRALHAAHAGGSAPGRPPLPRASTTSTTRLAAAALCLALGVPLDEIRTGLEGVSAAFGRAERIAVGNRALDPADQEPGRRQRGPAHADARARRARPPRRPQRQHRRRPRRLVGLGRRLRGPRAAASGGSCAAGRAAASSRCA